tara:strand:- start:436 stop:702 length:267 start_codon:yes stop_codon:yes gene_type:complete
LSIKIANRSSISIEEDLLFDKITINTEERTLRQSIKAIKNLLVKIGKPVSIPIVLNIIIVSVWWNKRGEDIISVPLKKNKISKIIFLV